MVRAHSFYENYQQLQNNVYYLNNDFLHGHTLNTVEYAKKTLNLINITHFLVICVHWIYCSPPSQ